MPSFKESAVHPSAPFISESPKKVVKREEKDLDLEVLRM